MNNARHFKMRSATAIQNKEPTDTSSILRGGELDDALKEIKKFQMFFLHTKKDTDQNDLCNNVFTYKRGSITYPYYT